ncbi:hypothetical protein [Ancylobacter lacus]|uniref:hypothetical protein n=1 Tax=Ancylobacter lacus TaxID=2579970 RepID=UPI001BCF13B7|nr:hypothetical protein [Ancylobacter lacus]MBS7541018.1 hypothetical protein [Ancylobacter lacus]
MIRFLLRFVGLWVLAGGFVALVVDGTRSIASSDLVMTPLGEAWFAAGPGSLARFQSLVETRLSPVVWEYAAVPLLMAPLAAVLGVAGLLLILLGRSPTDR